MSRLLPLLAFALLSAAVAAPVPPGGRPTFGANGLLSRTDLEKVRFDSRAVKREDGREWPEEAEAVEVKRVEKPGPARPVNRYDLAVHLPWAKFRAGEPVPAYFVLRNNRSAALGFNSRMNLHGAIPELHGGGMSLDVRDRATGKSVLKGLSGSTNCGGNSLVDVPADGFYCLKADLNRVTGGALPAGEYEVDWRCGRLASAPVAFTVAPADGAKPAAVVKPPHVHFYQLSHGPAAGAGPDTPGEPYLRDGHLGDVYTGSMASALAVGQHGVYVPDIHVIPAADTYVEAWAVWKPYREGDRVAVTLRAVPPHERVRFEELPQLFLQIDTPGEEAGRQWSHEQIEDAKQSERDENALVTPLTIELALPKDWRERAGASGTARVAVLVAAKRIEFPRGGDKLVKVAEKTDRRDRERGTDAPVWGGVVRTAFADLRFPPPAPPAPAP